MNSLYNYGNNSLGTLLNPSLYLILFCFTFIVVILLSLHLTVLITIQPIVKHNTTPNQNTATISSFFHYI